MGLGAGGQSDKTVLDLPWLRTLPCTGWNAPLRGAPVLRLQGFGAR